MNLETAGLGLTKFAITQIQEGLERQEQASQYLYELASRITSSVKTREVDNINPETDQIALDSRPARVDVDGGEISENNGYTLLRKLYESIKLEESSAITRLAKLIEVEITKAESNLGSSKLESFQEMSNRFLGSKKTILTNLLSKPHERQTNKEAFGKILNVILELAYFSIVITLLNDGISLAIEAPGIALTHLDQEEVAKFFESTAELIKHNHFLSLLEEFGSAAIFSRVLPQISEVEITNFAIEFTKFSTDLRGKVPVVITKYIVGQIVLHLFHIPFFDR